MTPTHASSSVVLLVACGGTIACRSGPNGVTVALSGSDLVQRAGIEDVDLLDASQVASWSFGPEALADIARTIVAEATSGRYAGVVVTHGTDTIEESMFLTWLLGGAFASERCPIVFTGACYYDDHPNADGPANVRDAVALAHDGGRAGPVLRFRGATHHARWVTKTDTTAPDTFRSQAAPTSGASAPTPPPYGDRIEPAVVQVPSYTGVDSDLIGWHLDRGARAIVVQGTGAGNVHANLVPGIQRAVAAEIPVLVTSRCWTGAVAPTYGGQGGGAHLAELGCISGGNLPTHKARVALWVALGRDPQPAAVRNWFEELLAWPGSPIPVSPSVDR